MDESGKKFTQGLHAPCNAIAKLYGHLLFHIESRILLGYTTNHSPDTMETGELTTETPVIPCVNCITANVIAKVCLAHATFSTNADKLLKHFARCHTSSFEKTAASLSACNMCATQ